MYFYIFEIDLIWSFMNLEYKLIYPNALTKFNKSKYDKIKLGFIFKKNCITYAQNVLVLVKKY